MKIHGLKIKYWFYLILGCVFLFPPMTPIGAAILIFAYKSAVEDEKKENREDAMKRRKARMEYEVVDAEEYEEVDVAYPDAEDEFENDEFIRNLKRWR